MDPASQASAVVGLPFAAVPAISKGYKYFFNKKSSERKWAARVESITTAVMETKGEYIPEHIMSQFLRLCDNYTRAKIAYYESLEMDRKSRYWGEGKKKGDRFISTARIAYANGLHVSQTASTANQRCQLYHTHVVRNANGKCSICFPPVYSQVGYFSSEMSSGDWTGFDRNMISISETRYRSTEPDPEGPQSTDRRPAVPSQLQVQPVECTVQLHHTPNHQGQLPHYEELAVRHFPASEVSHTQNETQERGPDAVSDDDDDSSVESDSETILQTEEIQALSCRFFRRKNNRGIKPIPEEPNPWASTSSLRDKLIGELVIEMSTQTLSE